MKRRGVVAYLVAAAAALMGQSNLTSRANTIALAIRQSLTLNLVDDNPASDDFGIASITVNYKGETVVLTAQEIMEALRPNGPRFTK